jgi:hypothetical protein
MLVCLCSYWRWCCWHPSLIQCRRVSKILHAFTQVPGYFLFLGCQTLPYLLVAKQCYGISVGTGKFLVIQ